MTINAFYADPYYCHAFAILFHYLPWLKPRCFNHLAAASQKRVTPMQNPGSAAGSEAARMSRGSWPSANAPRSTWGRKGGGGGSMEGVDQYSLRPQNHHGYFFPFSGDSHAFWGLLVVTGPIGLAAFSTVRWAVRWLRREAKLPTWIQGCRPSNENSSRKAPNWSGTPIPMPITQISMKRFRAKTQTFRYSLPSKGRDKTP